MHSNQYQKYLGQQVSSLVADIGSPFAQYSYRDGTHFTFIIEGVPVSCEVVDGTIKSIDTEKDRRSAVRVHPTTPMRVFLRHQQGRVQAEVIDLSVKSFALRLDSHLPGIGETVSFCTSLRVRANMEAYVSFTGTIHRADAKSGMLVVMLYLPFETHSQRMLQDYINSHQARAALFATYPPPAGRLTVIKSDICLLCEEKACGIKLPHSPYINRNRLPKHKGLTGATHAS